ncbi:hypothetical protein HYW20_06775 [Candidatus Woesearchaeota archaeon]|nr:hypothetical protein [Candidatus Woesearchaeota archaeon]
MKQEDRQLEYELLVPKEDAKSLIGLAVIIARKAELNGASFRQDENEDSVSVGDPDFAAGRLGNHYFNLTFTGNKEIDSRVYSTYKITGHAVIPELVGKTQQEWSLALNNVGYYIKNSQ